MHDKNLHHSQAAFYLYEYPYLSSAESRNDLLGPQYQSYVNKFYNSSTRGLTEVPRGQDESHYNQRYRHHSRACDDEFTPSSLRDGGV